MLNSAGPSANLWGTPLVSELHLDIEPLTAALWVRQSSQFLIHRVVHLSDLFPGRLSSLYMTSWLIRHCHFMLLTRIKEFWKTNSPFPRDVHCMSSATCFCSSLKTGCGRAQSSNGYIKFDCWLEYTSNSVEFHRKIAWYCGQLIFV